jgi:hypothetical protein
VTPSFGIGSQLGIVVGNAGLASIIKEVANKYFINFSRSIFLLQHIIEACNNRKYIFFARISSMKILVYK